MTPENILRGVYERAEATLDTSVIPDLGIRERAYYVCRCMSNLLHLFHRIRADYLNAYQELVLNEPDSAVSQTLKEAFLALRQAAESDE